MPRTNRYFIPGYTWHVTHRRHKQEFLLKFARDRKKWIDEALSEHILAREAKCLRSIAVGSEAFVNQVVDTVSQKEGKRETVTIGDSFVVREPSTPCSPHFDSNIQPLRLQNT